MLKLRNLSRRGRTFGQNPCRVYLVHSTEILRSNKCYRYSLVADIFVKVTVIFCRIYIDRICICDINIDFYWVSTRLAFCCFLLRGKQQHSNWYEGPPDRITWWRNKPTFRATTIHSRLFTQWQSRHQFRDYGNVQLPRSLGFFASLYSYASPLVSTMSQNSLTYVFCRFSDEQYIVCDWSGRHDQISGSTVSLLFVCELVRGRSIYLNSVPRLVQCHRLPISTR